MRMAAFGIDLPSHSISTRNIWIFNNHLTTRMICIKSFYKFFCHTRLSNPTSNFGRFNAHLTSSRKQLFVLFSNCISSSGGSKYSKYSKYLTPLLQDENTTLQNYKRWSGLISLILQSSFLLPFFVSLWQNPVTMLSICPGQWKINRCIRHIDLGAEIKGSPAIRSAMKNEREISSQFQECFSNLRQCFHAFWITKRKLISIVMT